MKRHSSGDKKKSKNKIGFPSGKIFVANKILIGYEKEIK